MTDVFEKIQNDFNEFMKQAKELVEKERVANTTETNRWKPKDGDVYYSVMSIGNIVKYSWGTDYIDSGHYRLGNCFKTKQEAQKELERRVAERELLEMCDWEGGDQYNLLYHCKTNTFNSVYSLNFIQNPYRFASKKSCQQAIEQLGTEKLKLVFRID